MLKPYTRYDSYAYGPYSQWSVTLWYILFNSNILVSRALHEHSFLEVMYQEFNVISERGFIMYLEIEKVVERDLPVPMMNIVNGGACVIIMTQGRTPYNTWALAI